MIANEQFDNSYYSVTHWLFGCRIRRIGHSLHKRGERAMSKTIWCVAIVVLAASCSGAPVPPLQILEHPIFGTVSFQPVADTGPIAPADVEAFRKLGFIGVFRIGIQGSTTFSGNVSVEHRAQRSDTGHWSETRHQTLTVTRSTGEAINFPTERTIDPPFLIRHEFTCEFPSHGGIVVTVARGGALVKFLEQKPTEDFSFAISFAEPHEIDKQAKQTIFAASWISQGTDEVTGQTKEYAAATEFLREARDQLWMRHKEGMLDLFCQLFAPEPDDEPKLTIPALIKMTIKRIDPPEKDKKPSPTGTIAAL